MAGRWRGVAAVAVAGSARSTALRLALGGGAADCDGAGAATAGAQLAAGSLGRCLSLFVGRLGADAGSQPVRRSARCARLRLRRRHLPRAAHAHQPSPPADHLSAAGRAELPAASAAGPASPLDARGGAAHLEGVDAGRRSAGASAAAAAVSPTWPGSAAGGDVGDGPADRHRASAERSPRGAGDCAPFGRAAAVATFDLDPQAPPSAYADTSSSRNSPKKWRGSSRVAAGAAVWWPAGGGGAGQAGSAGGDSGGAAAAAAVPGGAAARRGRSRGDAAAAVCPARPDHGQPGRIWPPLAHQRWPIRLDTAAR